MNERQFNKLVEQRHIQRLLENRYGNTDTGSHFDDSPDATIEIDGKTIGIEHTRYYVEHNGKDGLSPLAQERAQSKIVSKAWEIFKQRNLLLLYLLVDFDDPTTFFGRDVDRMAEELAVSVEHLLGAGLTKNEHYVVEAWRARRYGRPLPSSIRHILLSITDSSGPELWGVTRSGGCHTLQSSQVQAVIDEKNNHVSEYLQKCSEAWLLIVVEGGSPAGYFQVEPPTTTHMYSSAFSKVFVLRSFHDELYELPVQGHL